jgi:hypothetical protein
MKDRPTASLKIDLREQREWLANNPGDFRVGDYRRRIKEGLEEPLHRAISQLIPESCSCSE